MTVARVLLFAAFMLNAAGQTLLADSPIELEYAPAPLDNPLKGLVPYRGDVRDKFAHSLEFEYVPYSALVKGYDRFDWRPLDKLLDDIASRGHQAVVRIFLEYPGRSNAIPKFLIDDGLKITKWQHAESEPGPESSIETPDYHNQALRRSLKNFVNAFGKRYDGDPRLGFITAGLLGIWGEWHNYPKSDLFASVEVQAEVMDAYESAFRITPVLLRYPAGTNQSKKAANAHRKFGYHDDSFAWATLDTGKKGDEWFYMTTLKSAGPDAENKWKTRPIGGEIRPEAWGHVFDRQSNRDKIQDFRTCVETTHVTWLMDSGMFREMQSAERIKQAESEVRRMGYEFHANSVTIRKTRNAMLAVALQIENRGVAPFYYDWTPEFGLLLSGKAIKTWKSNGTLTGLFPGEKNRVWEDSFDVGTVKAGIYSLVVRVPNPLKGGKAVRFANRTQERSDSGWLVLGEVKLP